MKGKKPRNPPPKTVSLHCDTSTDDSRPVLYAGANRAGIVTAAGSWPLTLETQRGKRGRSSPFQYRYRGDIKVAKTSADTVSAVTYEYSIVCSEMDELRKWVRATANPDADKAKAAFRKSTLLKGADDIVPGHVQAEDVHRRSPARPAAAPAAAAGRRRRPAACCR